MTRTDGLSLTVPPELLDQLADLIAERVAHKLRLLGSPEIYTPATAAVRLGMTTDAVRKAINRGEIVRKQHAPGCKIEITREALEAYEQTIKRSSRARRRV